MKRNEPESSSFPLVPPSLEEQNENIDNPGQSPAKNPKIQKLAVGSPVWPPYYVLIADGHEQQGITCQGDSQRCF